MSDVKKIMVVSNTHWDREFRFSFEKTRNNLLKMLDITLDIMENDPKYHSFTMDGHSIMIDDYLELRPEKKALVKRLISEGRLIIGPYYTLAEEFSVSQEALVRNLIFGRKKLNEYGAPYNTVAYTPSSWGQTGQYPQILKDFGIDKIMFYRGISHDEAPAEYIWEAPDGTQMFASRFALYCRYNWYYQVHRAVTRHKVWKKDYHWGEYDDVPFCIADSSIDGSMSFDLKSPKQNYDRSVLRKAIEDMLKEEDGHFTTPIFLGMNGHDISVAYPLESKIISDAQKEFAGEIEIEHTDLEHFWKEAQKYFDRDNMTVLKGERRAYLKKGKWTYLFPSTISARTYLKQQDFNASTKLTGIAEPASALCFLLFGTSLKKRLDRGWQFLLSNHTHDANGGCAPDSVCLDMEYRYRKASDIGDIVATEALAEIAENLSPVGIDKDAVQLVVFNPLPYKRTVITKLTVNMPLEKGEGISADGMEVQTLFSEKNSIFADSIWDVPTIMDCVCHEIYAQIDNVPACGYKTIMLSGKKKPESMQQIGNDNVLENIYLKVTINHNGTINVLNKETGKQYENVNYFTSQGEIGNAWCHKSPENDCKFSTLSENAEISITENGNLSATVKAQLSLKLPVDCIETQNTEMTTIPITVYYTLQKNDKAIKIHVDLVNTAKDHWLRANFATSIEVEQSICDSHFDIVKHNVKIPDSTDWVEPAFGMQPLRTYAAVCDGQNGFAVMPRGLYEYEVFEDTTMALTLIRGCRIKQAVSEEKVTVLNDLGVLCLGNRDFDYVLYFFEKQTDELGNRANDYNVPAICAQTGRGNGDLSLSNSLLSINNPKVNVTAIKIAENERDFVVRLCNPNDEEQTVTIDFGFNINKLCFVKLSEEDIGPATNTFIIGRKKIITIKVGGTVHD